MMGEHCAIFVHADSFPGDRIYAVHGIFDGKVEDRDNYMAYYFREKASSYLTEIAKEVYGECRAFYEPEEEAVIPNWIGKNSDVKELLRSTKPYYSVILPSGQDMDEKDKKLDEFELTLGDLTDEERKIIIDGCLINHNKPKDI